MKSAYKNQRIDAQLDQTTDRMEESNEMKTDQLSIAVDRQSAGMDQLIITVVPVDGVNEERGHQVVLELRVLHVLLRLREKLLIARCGDQPFFNRKLNVELLKNRKVLEHLDLFNIHINQSGDTNTPIGDKGIHWSKIQNEIIDALLGCFRPKLILRTEYDLSGHSSRCQKCRDQDQRDEQYFDTLHNQTIKHETNEGFEQTHARIVKRIQDKYIK